MIKMRGKNSMTKTKKGGASLYVVIFTTFLLSIIAVSFLRIMISEANQTTDYDLSQSAYDSALAGVEDAKVALLLYHDCVSRADTSSPTCQAAMALREQNSDQDCDIVRRMLGRPVGDDLETVIQSEAGSVEQGTGVSMDQAYTCVTMTENTNDYVGNMSNTNRVRLIPIRPVDANEVNWIRIKWFSDNDTEGTNIATLPAHGNLHNNNRPDRTSVQNSNFFGNYSDSDRNTPPVLEFQFLQTDLTFNLSQLDYNNGAFTNRGTLVFVPNSNGTNSISNSSTVGLAASADKAPNSPIPVQCTASGAWHCAMDVELPKPFNGGNRNTSTSFIRLSLPYGQPTADFSIEMYDRNPADSNAKLIRFNGVQAKIDSTGRANELFRRVETRVELVDTYFPIPEFLLNLSGANEDTIYKNFWVTYNPWNEMGNSGYIDK
jgi:Tfp pilus assembly protein PilX